MDEEELKGEGDEVISTASSSDPPSSDSRADAAPTAVNKGVVISSKGGVKRKLLPPSVSTGSKKATTEAPFSLFDPIPLSSPSVQTYRNCLLSHFFPSSSSYPPSSFSSLPGPQPASLTRADLAKLEAGQYWACEKSDGERCIVLIHSHSKTVVLVDRKWSCRLMKKDCGDLLVSLLASQGDTAVDAEWMEVERGREEEQEGGLIHRLSMFDVLVVNGERMAERMFGGIWNSAQPPVSDGTGRLDVILQQITGPYKEAIAQAKSQQSAPAILLDRHLELCVKEFVPKHHVDLILSRISHHPSSNPRFPSHSYTYKSRSNSNDGLIFTPDRDSYYCRQTPLLKWKWPDLNTIDFVVQAPYESGEKGLPLLCAGHCREREGRLVVHDVVFDYIRRMDETSAALVAELRRKGGASAVVECGYSRSDSDWHIKGVRWDKSNSNFLTTVVATMKAIMDDLQSADIVQACKKNKFQYRRTNG